MSMYYQGFNEAYQWVKDQAEVSPLLDYIDALYGRDNLDDQSDLDQVKAEALRQCKEDFTDKDSPEYERLQFHLKVAEQLRNNL